MGSFAGRALGWLVFVAIVTGGLEISLRIMPDLIPLTLLKRFQKDTRLDIAQKRSLWNESQMWILEREDGGPILKLFKPHSKIAYDFHGKDEKGITLMDDQGFCNPRRDPYHRERIDIIAIGDSFTWCVVLNPEATWSSQLGAISGLSIYNLGRGGIGPYAYLQIFKRFCLPKRPEYVIMNIYEGNDLRDSIRYHQHIQAAKEGRVLYADAGDRNTREIDTEALLGYPLARKSYALNFLVAVVDKGYEGIKKALVRAAGGVAPEHVDFRYRLNFPDRAIEFNIQNADESEVRFARKLKRGDIELSVFDEALSNLVALGRKHGFRAVVAYSPSAYTGYSDFVEFVDSSLIDLMPWFSRTQREYLSTKATELGYTFVDLTPIIQKAGRSLQDAELLYYPINVHFTPKGHSIVAGTLAETLPQLQAHNAKRHQQ